MNVVALVQLFIGSLANSATADQGDGSFRRSEDSGRGSHGSELDWGDNESSDVGEETIEQDRELQSSYADSEDTLTPLDGNLQPMRKRSISDGCIAGMERFDDEEEDTLKVINGLEHSEKLHQELDFSSREMQSLIDSLNGDLGSSSATNLRCRHEDDTMSEEQDTARLEAYQEEGGVVRRRSRTTLSATLAERHAVASTISLSEPDLTVIGVNPRSPPPVLPRTVESPVPRRGSGWSSGLSSAESSPYRYGSAMTSLPASHKHLSMARSVPAEDRFGASLNLPKSPSSTVDRKIARLVRRGRKSETLPSGKPPASPILGKSSSMFFSDSPKSKGIKGHFKGLKKKVDKLTKKHSNVNFDETDCPQKTSRSPGPSRHTTPRTSLSFTRHGSVSTDAPIGLTSSLPSVDEVRCSPTARRRNTSSSQGSALPLVTKIFSVLQVWQENHFEVSALHCR